MKLPKVWIATSDKDGTITFQPVDYPVYVLDQSTDYKREYLSPTRCEISGFFDEVGEGAE
jgi:hypothetical protein